MLPKENKLPESFYKISKSFQKAKVIEVKLCSICEKKLNLNNICPSKTCLSNLSPYRFKPIKVFILDIKKQITFILENNYDSILKNLGNFHFKKISRQTLIFLLTFSLLLASIKNDGYICDIISGLKYKYREDFLNLVLFADGVNYNKSSNKTIWAILSSIVELPQVLRDSHENIIAHSLWSGSNPDFNLFLEYYNKPTTDLLTNGLDFRGKIIKFKM